MKYKVNFEIDIKLIEKERIYFPLKNGVENLCLNGSLDFQKYMYINENMLYTNLHKDCNY